MADALEQWALIGAAAVVTAAVAVVLYRWAAR